MFYRASPLPTSLPTSIPQKPDKMMVTSPDQGYLLRPPYFRSESECDRCSLPAFVPLYMRSNCGCGVKMIYSRAASNVFALYVCTTRYFKSPELMLRDKLDFSGLCDLSLGASLKYGHVIAEAVGCVLSVMKTRV